MWHKFSDTGAFRVVFSKSRAVFSNLSKLTRGLEKASTLENTAIKALLRRKLMYRVSTAKPSAVKVFFN
jgi:hypothetical protein